MKLLCWRLLQGISAGLIGVVVPLYLAECLSASSRGKGTEFPMVLTLGIVTAAIVACSSAFASKRWQSSATLPDFGLQGHAWRSIFWVSLPPASVRNRQPHVAESRAGFSPWKRDAAQTALLRSRTQSRQTLNWQKWTGCRR